MQGQTVASSGMPVMPGSGYITLWQRQWLKSTSMALHHLQVGKEIWKSPQFIAENIQRVNNLQNSTNGKCLP
jgi:hypothetical protein